MKRGFTTVTESGACRVDEDSEQGLVVLHLVHEGQKINHSMTPSEAKFVATNILQTASEVRRAKRAKANGPG
jgi:hypothetical protein